MPNPNKAHCKNRNQWDRTWPELPMSAIDVAVQQCVSGYMLVTFGQKIQAKIYTEKKTDKTTNRKQKELQSSFEEWNFECRYYDRKRKGDI